MVYKIQNATSDYIEKKYKVITCGSDIAMPGGIINEIALCFKTKEAFTKENLRESLIEFSQKLLTEIQNDKDIQAFLNPCPFGIKNFQVIIYNKDSQGYGVTDPEISTAEISRGILTYRTIDKENTYRFKNKFQETYEEDLDKLKQKY